MDIAPNIYAAVMGNSAITSLLSTWDGDPAVFTRRPLPGDATYPLVAISPDVAYTDQDFLASGLDVVIRDVFVFGHQPDDFRDVEKAAHLIRKLFHRQNQALGSSDIHVVSVTASGPRIAPSDDAAIVGRVVTLTIRMQEK